MNRDALINDYIRLKNRPAAPVERWQMVPAIRRSASAKNLTSQTQLPSSPLKQITNTQDKIFPQTPKTPKSHKLIVKAKSSKKKQRRRSKSLDNSMIATTPGLHKTPRGSHRTPGRNGGTPAGCRFIPNEATTDMEYSSFLLRQKDRQPDSGDENEGGGQAGTVEYKQAIINAISRGRGHQQRGVLSFKSTTPSASTSYIESEVGGASSCRASAKSTRLFPSGPEKTLDAPNLTDDYYLNTLDWGRANLLAIGLGSCVYLWNASDGNTEQLLDLGEEQTVTSVAWSGNGKYLAVGDSSATIQLWDVQKHKRIRAMKGHHDRVGALAWNRHTLASGSRDGAIFHNDTRKPDHIVAQSHYHRSEVCGMEWSPDGQKLASGGNDNLVCVWKASNPAEPLHLLQGHKAAVKAVAWCPWQANLLATGGGTKDMTIRLWNTFTGQCTQVVDTKSQVPSLHWNKYHKQLISAHGYPRNHMVIRQYPTMARLGSLSGHSERILHMCLSPGKSRVASAGSDETLKIWQCFEKVKLDQSERSYTEISALLHSLN